MIYDNQVEPHHARTHRRATQQSHHNLGSDHLAPPHLVREVPNDARLDQTRLVVRELVDARSKQRHVDVHAAHRESRWVEAASAAQDGGRRARRDRKAPE